jgi:hypothetical protein
VGGRATEGEGERWTQVDVRGVVPGSVEGVGLGVTVTVTLAGEIAATVTADGSAGTTATSWVPGSRPLTLIEMTIADELSRSRSAVEPNSVSRTWRSPMS